MPAYVVDLESDSLLDGITKIHVVSYTPVSGYEPKSMSDPEEIREFFNQPDLTIIGHNFVQFDSVALEMVLGIPRNYRIVDTLMLSWALESSSNIVKHGLEAWGEYLGVKKPEISSWTDLTYEDYRFRCEQDIHINLLLWKRQQSQLMQIYDRDSATIHRYIDYLTDKAEVFREQNETGFELDLDKCIDSLVELQNLADEKTDALIHAMPKRPIKDTKRKPKVMYKANGELSNLGERWLEFLNEYGYGPSEEGPIEYIKDYEDGNPASSEQVKDWLYSLGWEPQHIKFVRDKKTNEYRQIPQYVSEYEKGELCDSVKALIEKEPALENLSGLSTINHRIGFLKGFIEHFRGTKVYQEIGGLTNTLRVKHRVPLANLPKPGLPWSDSIRSCLIATGNEVMIGSDLSSIEDKVKFFYIYPYDPDFVNEMMSADFDPHLSTAIAGGLITKEQSDMYKFVDKGVGELPEQYRGLTEEQLKAEFNKVKEKRQIGKTGNYALQYGSGVATLARQCKLDKKTAENLHKGYWDRNKSIKQFAAACERKTIDGQMWVKQPISGFWYSLRTDKDVMSTVTQSAAVYIFDRWVHHVRKRGLKISGCWHDELVAYTYEGELEWAKEQVNLAMEDLNKELQLTVTIECSIATGKKYSEVH